MNLRINVYLVGLYYIGLYSEMDKKCLSKKLRYLESFVKQIWRNLGTALVTT